MKKYRKKPVIIEAIQWTGLNLEEIKSFVGESLQYDIVDTAWEVGKGTPNVNMIIKTLEGDHICTKGDFIIKGVKGEFYPCKADIFYETYELAETDVKKTIPNEWISVYSNEKPKDRREYFVAYVFGDSDMHFYGTERYHAFEGNGIVNRPHFSNEGVHEMRVTHWMPIPQLPKNEEEEE